MKHRMSEFTSEFCQRYNHDSPVEVLWSSLRDKLLQLLDMFVQFKMKLSCPTVPLVTRNIKQLRRCKQMCYNRVKLTNLPVHWQEFKDLKCIMQRECRRSFNKHMFNTLHEPYLSGKKKKLFRYIKSLRSDRCGINTLLIIKQSLSYWTHPIFICFYY